MSGNPHNATDVVVYTYTVYVDLNLDWTQNISLKCLFKITCLFKAILYKVYFIKHKVWFKRSWRFIFTNHKIMALLNTFIFLLYFHINLSLFSYKSDLFLLWLLYLFGLLTLIRGTEEPSSILFLNRSSYRKRVICVCSRCVLIGCREVMRSFFFRWWYYFPELRINFGGTNVKNMKWLCGLVLYDFRRWTFEQMNFTI